jgi:hypothetical protein
VPGTEQQPGAHGPFPGSLDLLSQSPPLSQVFRSTKHFCPGLAPAAGFWAIGHPHQALPPCSHSSAFLSPTCRALSARIIRDTVEHSLSRLGLWGRLKGAYSACCSQPVKTRGGGSGQAALPPGSCCLEIDQLPPYPGALGRVQTSFLGFPWLATLCSSCPSPAWD